MKTVVIKIIVCLFCFTLLCCGKKKQKECVGVGTLTNIEDSVFFFNEYSDVITGIMWGENTTSLVDNIGERNVIGLITNETTFNKFVDTIKSNNPNLDIKRIQDVNPDFAINSIIIIHGGSIPYQSSETAISYELLINDTEKTATVNFTLKGVWKTNTRKHYIGTPFATFLITKKIDPTYKPIIKFENINCKKRIL